MFASAHRVLEQEHLLELKGIKQTNLIATLLSHTNEITSHNVQIPLFS